MKKLNYLLLIALPVFMLSCNDQSSNRNKNNDGNMNGQKREMKKDNNNTGTTGRDTMRLEEKR